MNQREQATSMQLIHHFIFFKPAKIAYRLFYVSIVLFILSLMSVLLHYQLQLINFYTNGLVYFFDASEEANIPTLFSTLLLFISSLLLFLLYYLSPSASSHTNRIYWLLLGLIFLFLTIDEATSVHEQFNKIRAFMAGDANGFMTYPWVLPYLLLVLVFGVFFFKFLVKLPIRTTKLFIISGIIYVTAALGFELLEGRTINMFGKGNVYDKLLCSVEEFLEMTGIIIFIYALLDYLTIFHISLLPRIKPNEDHQSRS